MRIIIFIFLVLKIIRVKATWCERESEDNKTIIFELLHDPSSSVNYEICESISAHQPASLRSVSTTKVSLFEVEKYDTVIANIRNNKKENNILFIGDDYPYFIGNNVVINILEDNPYIDLYCLYIDKINNLTIHSNGYSMYSFYIHIHENTNIPFIYGELSDFQIHMLSKKTDQPIKERLFIGSASISNPDKGYLNIKHEELTNDDIMYLLSTREDIFKTQQFKITKEK